MPPDFCSDQRSSKVLTNRWKLFDFWYSTRLPYPESDGMTQMFKFAITILAILCGSVAAKAESEPTGIWRTQAGDANVKVTKCGGGLCGVIVSVRDKIDPATGKAPTDDKNPNPALKNRPIVGLTLFSGMRPVGPNKWSGTIYNADDGSSYASNVSVTSPDQLRVEGCVGPICGGENWMRVR